MSARRNLHSNLYTEKGSKAPMSNGKPMTTITMRVDEALAEQVEQAAAKDRRPVSAFVRNLVADALAKPEQAPKSEIAA
jgi:molybdopterin-guanine dinucleotide biosynthesis protein A